MWEAGYDQARLEVIYVIFGCSTCITRDIVGVLLRCWFHCDGTDLSSQDESTSLKLCTKGWESQQQYLKAIRGERREHKWKRGKQ